MFARGSGVLLHITSLPSPYGIGDLGFAGYAFADRLRSSKQSYWQVLPLNPTEIATCNSPYLSTSAFAGNTLLISPDKLVEDGLLSKDETSVSGFPDGFVDFRRVAALKRRLLSLAYRRFDKSRDKEEFVQFCSGRHKTLHDFALFMTLRSKFRNQPWNLWPELLRRRDPDALTEVEKRYKDDIRQWKWYQFVFERQWSELKKYCNERSIKIIGDVPIYVAYDSADVWSHPELFKLDKSLRPTAVSGVPPDYFSATGQLWNNPVYDWDSLERSGFSWWIDRMRTTLERFDIVRIDHFRGLVQYWEVPAGEKTAMNGTWRPVPSDSFFSALRTALPHFPVIAEDLGIITDDVKAAMSRYGFPGMKVLLFAFGSDDPFHPYLPHMYERNCIVYTGTHDNSTVREWFTAEADSDTRRRFCSYCGLEKSGSARFAVDAMTRLAQASVADVAIVPVQDIFGLGRGARMNRPSIPKGNWKWRMTPEQMEKFPVDKLAAMAESYGRVKGVAPDHPDCAR